MYEPTSAGKGKKIGDISDSGPRVERVRRIMDRLRPPYIGTERLRVRVIDTKEWNASAMGNGAIWVYSGLLDAMSDDEMAIVLGHELTHFTHEHSRRNAKRGMFTQIIGLSAIVASSTIDNNAARTSAMLGQHVDDDGVPVRVQPGPRGSGRSRRSPLRVRGRLRSEDRAGRCGASSSRSTASPTRCRTSSSAATRGRRIASRTSRRNWRSTTARNSVSPEPDRGPRH